MKPKNFPGRKNTRRIEALERLPHRKGSPSAPVSETDRAATLANTTALIIDETVARAIRTKKPLLGGSPERRAHHAGKMHARG